MSNKDTRPSVGKTNIPKSERPQNKNLLRTAGPGRPKGVPNKMTTDAKQMIMDALGQAGGVEYLVAQAHENPKAFLSLVGRVLPYQVQGDANAPLAITIVKGLGD